jgi:RNA polymerase sigma-70 factor (ECF subfamily)
MTDPIWLAERFEGHRVHLRAVAYRMLGSAAEAEDTVQDAWLRASRADAASIENLGGWLTTIVARLCLDRLRSRAVRREDPAGLELPELVVTGVDGPLSGAETTAATDPERQALLADSIGVAMLIILDRLTPTERIAFVLHDAFGLPYDEIAPIVERTPTATRQLASRARRRVRGAAPPAADVPLARQRELVDAFIAAARAGDFEALLRVLDPDVIVRGETAAARGPFAGLVEVRGAREAATQALAFARVAAGARPAIVNGRAGVVVFSGARPFAVMGFTTSRDTIIEIDIVLRPDRLARLDLRSLRL